MLSSLHNMRTNLRSYNDYSVFMWTYLGDLAFKLVLLAKTQDEGMLNLCEQKHYFNLLAQYEYVMQNYIIYYAHAIIFYVRFNENYFSFNFSTRPPLCSITIIIFSHFHPTTLKSPTFYFNQWHCFKTKLINTWNLQI